MANNIIEIHKDANAQKVSPGQIVTLGEGTNFDTVTERWYFGSGLPQGYQAGGVLKPVPVQGAVPNSSRLQLPVARVFVDIKSNLTGERDGSDCGG